MHVLLINGAELLFFLSFTQFYAIKDSRNTQSYYENINYKRAV